MSRSHIAASGAHHTVSEEEIKGLVDFVNNVVPDAKLDPNGSDVFERLKDGVILCKLIKAIDASVLKKDPIVNFHPDKSAFQKLENLNAVLEAAPRLGCQIVNVGGSDLAAGTPHLVLGVLWQIVRVGLMRKVAALAKVDMQGEEILLKWMNSHLKAAGSTRTVTNFGTDLQDGVNLTVLLNQLEPTICSKDPLKETDLMKRAELILQNAEKIGCRKFITAADIVKANTRLNTAFLATLFAKYPKFGSGDESKPKGPSEVDLLKQEIDALKHENASLKQENNDLKHNNSNLQQQLENLKQSLTELEQLRHERVQLQNQLNELEALKKENAQLKQDIENLRLQMGNLAALQEELERLRKENAQLQNQLPELEVLRKENTQLKQDVENLRLQMGSLAALQEELERLRKENTQLQNDLTNAHTTIQSKEVEIQQLKEVEQKLRVDLEGANKEIENLRNELNALKQQTQMTETQFNEQLAMLKVTHQQEVEEVTKRVREEDTKKLEEAKQNWDNELATLQREFQEQIDNLKKTAQERETQFKEQLDKENAIASEKLKEREEQLIKEFEEKEHQLREEYEKRERDLTKRLQEIASKGLEERSAELQKTFDEKERKLQDQLKERDKRIQEMKAAEAENQKRLQDEIGKLKKDLEDAKQREKKLRQMMAMPPEREGWLVKMTRNEKLLKRWFLLRGEFLLFYREKHPKNMAKTAGAIFLTDSTVTPLDEETSIAKTGDKKMKFAFQIESKYANRVYLLVAPDDKTRKDWVDSIENMKAWYKSLQDAGKEEK